MAVMAMNVAFDHHVNDSKEEGHANAHRHANDDVCRVPGPVPIPERRLDVAGAVMAA